MNYFNYPFSFSQDNIKKYELLTTIGEGANGKVYKAKRNEDGTIVAIKYLNHSDSKSRFRFENEIKVYTQLRNCPFIVKILDYSLNSFKPYLVMEFCQYKNARNQMALFLNHQSLGVGLLLGVAKGIKQIHELNTYHRDIKPDNLLLTTDAYGNYILKIGDAGMSCFLPHSSSFYNATYSLQGTPTYIAPELFLGKEFSAAADVFSFGVTCHELLTGVRPLAGQKVTRGPIEMRNIIERMINVNPNNRPSIEQVIAEMKIAFDQVKFNHNINNLATGFFKAGAIFGTILLGVKILDELFDND